MSFDISMEFLGLNEMQKEIERLSTESELKAQKKIVNKKISYYFVPTLYIAFF